jgi:hypothetical protein
MHSPTIKTVIPVSFKIPYILIFPTLMLQVETAASTIVVEGPWILNSTSRQRIHLKCVNWYGAHQELYVVGGLELKSVSNLTDAIQASGANCVRLPYSIEMVKYNPVVRPDAVAGILPSDRCNSTLRALDVMDCVVYHLQKRGILLIFNNHNSWGSWVGAGPVKYQQGLWNMPGYSSEDWIQSMETITERYKITGMDFRNEIHDQYGVKITWGETDDVNTDWLAASSAAYERLHRIDPEILAIVGGLCWNTDLRAMTKKVGPQMAFDNGKLVFTVHVYTFSFWWNADNHLIENVVTPISLWLSVILFTSSAIGFFECRQERRMKQQSRGCAYNIIEENSPCHRFQHHPRRKNGPELQSETLNSPSATAAFLATSIIFHVGWLALAVFYFNTATSAGCSSFAADSVWLITLSSILTLCSGTLFFCYCFTLSKVASFSLLWASFFFMSVHAVGNYLSSDTAYYDSLKTWALEDRTVPVWVGEIGTGTPNEDSFQLLWRFIRDNYDLDFAYWAFNGRKFTQQGWESESFGLMNDQYSDWRFPHWNAFL